MEQVDFEAMAPVMDRFMSTCQVCPITRKCREDRPINGAYFEELHDYITMRWCCHNIYSLSCMLSDGSVPLETIKKLMAKAEEIDAKPLARIVGYAQAAVEPKFLFYAPAVAIPKLLEKIGWTLDDVDLIELNEAFAAQVLADGYALADRNWDWDKVNVNGGAIALGHPIGASGARVLTTLVYALRDRGLKRGLASLCLGGAEAVAMAVEIPES